MRIEGNFEKFVIFLAFAFENVAFCREPIRDPFAGENRQKDLIWENALDLMTFHRDKMNEYLCKNYIASEIVEGFRNLSIEGVHKRDGRPRKTSRMARESMLEDAGSKKYKDWLSRSSTLEDIYHQFEHAEADSSEHEEMDHSEYESEQDGEVTGYALIDAKHLYQKPIKYETGHHHHHIGLIPDHHFHYHEEDGNEEKKGLKLKELFHFALTSIAFLAFATFMIEVLVCLMGIPGGISPDYILVPTGDTGPGYKSENESFSENRRQTRSLMFDSVSLEELNVMSAKVLSSIEGLALIREDGGECFQRALCQNSKYSKTLSGSQKMWLPLWSFGIGWIGSRLSKEMTPSGDANALKYLKAAVMGLGSKECHVLHPDCDDNIRRRKNKSRH